MSAPLDILTRGLLDGSPLAIATRGLLVGSEGPGAINVAAGLLSVDAALLPSSEQPSIALGVEDGDLAHENGLTSSVLVSLFTDRLSEADDFIPDGTDDRRGWWGDLVPVGDLEDDQIGSRLWLLAREKQTTETRLRAEEYARESLEWMIEDGVAASVDVEAEWVRRGLLALGITIHQPDSDDTRFRFAVTWEGV